MSGKSISNFEIQGALALYEIMKVREEALARVANEQPAVMEQLRKKWANASDFQKEVLREEHKRFKEAAAIVAGLAAAEEGKAPEPAVTVSYTPELS